jgi:hypothetical protein
METPGISKLVSVEMRASERRDAPTEGTAAVA